MWIKIIINNNSSKWKNKHWIKVKVPHPNISNIKQPNISIPINWHTKLNRLIVKKLIILKLSQNSFMNNFLTPIRWVMLIKAPLFLIKTYWINIFKVVLPKGFFLTFNCLCVSNWLKRVKFKPSVLKWLSRQ